MMDLPLCQCEEGGFLELQTFGNIEPIMESLNIIKFFVI